MLATLLHYPPSSRVGAWLATHELLARLAERGHTVSVTTDLGDPGDYYLDGVHVYPRLPARHLAQTADVIVTHLGLQKKPSERRHMNGAYHVVMVHGYGPLNGLMLERLAPQLVVFNSRSMAETNGYDGPREVMYPPVWPDRFRTTRGDAVTLVSLTEAKGADLFYRLAAALPGTPFLGVIGGYGKQDIRDLPNVTIVDTTTDMREVYSRTRVLLMPSAQETYGMVGVEAMCSGIPVIAHPTPGLLESLRDAGTFADRDDDTMWLAALADLDDPATYGAASHRASTLTEQLTPTVDLDRVADRIESLVRS